MTRADIQGHIAQQEYYAVHMAYIIRFSHLLKSDIKLSSPSIDILIQAHHTDRL